MNKHRRKQILEAISQIESLVQDILDEEQEAFDNMPEGLQYSSRGMDSEAAIENLDEALEYLEEIDEIEDMEEIKTNISMAIDCLEDALVYNKSFLR